MHRAAGAALPRAAQRGAQRRRAARRGAGRREFAGVAEPGNDRDVKRGLELERRTERDAPEASPLGRVGWVRVALSQVVGDADRGASGLVHEVRPAAPARAGDGDDADRVERRAIGDEARQETRGADGLVHAPHRARSVTATVLILGPGESWHISVRDQGLNQPISPAVAAGRRRCRGSGTIATRRTKWIVGTTAASRAHTPKLKRAPPPRPPGSPHSVWALGSRAALPRAETERREPIAEPTATQFDAALHLAQKTHTKTVS